MITITRKFTFDAGHRVLGHEDKCRHIHGHTYTAEVTVQASEAMAPQLDPLGRVVDFSVIKEKVGGWIEAQWDHNFIGHEEDPLIIAYYYPNVLIRHHGPSSLRLGDLFGSRAPFVMHGKKNPTAENLAETLWYMTNTILASDKLTCGKVRMWETPNCFADYENWEFGK